MSLFLSRAELRRDAPSAALVRLLVPEKAGERTGAAHRLVWTLFGDEPDRRRDYLWREEQPGKFLALSARPPADVHGLFKVEHKEFAPVLRRGDMLRFSLRANATVARSTGPGQRGRRHDVVMDALRATYAEARADVRQHVAQAEGRAWLERQGAAHGFALLDGDEGCCVESYQRVEVPRPGARPAVLGVLDLAGVLAVVDPDAVVKAIGTGFGRARGYGFGLMLVRRA